MIQTANLYEVPDVKFPGEDPDPIYVSTSTIQNLMKYQANIVRTDSHIEEVHPGDQLDETSNGRSRNRLERS